MSKSFHQVGIFSDGTYGTNLPKTAVPEDPITQGVHRYVMYKETSAIRNFSEHLSPDTPQIYLSGPGTDHMHAKEKTFF